MQADALRAAVNSPQRGLERIDASFVRRWTERGVWAICDQGLFASANFLVNVLLARWLTREEYGAFVISYTVLLLISVVHGGMLAEPMVVFGAGRYADRFGDYLRILVRYHLKLTIAAGAVVAVGAVGVAGVFGTAVAIPLFVTAAIAPCVLFAWLVRRACYVRASPGLAAAGSAIYAAVIAGGLTVLALMHMLSAVTALLLMAGAALIASGLPLRVLSRGGTGPVDPRMPAEVRRTHWDYGRWSSATGLLHWGHTQSYYLTLPFLWSGLGASALLKAVSNLIMPVVQADTALMGLLVPVFVRHRDEPDAFAHRVQLALAYFLAEALLYGSVLVLFGSELIHAVYGGRYPVTNPQLALMAALPVFGGISNVCSSATVALENPRPVFRATASAAVVMCTVGLWSTHRFGVTGAMFGMLCSSATQAAVVATAVYRNARRARGSHGD